ncbi:E3 ubiquitin-protein ligase KEG-like [Apium graveolens]|uniref:E3 ubiquitin-protein ligase KEG-like n=1 Tax=Apium graveolens TaxID=4045 RepID=UPI003D7AE79A
MIGECLQFKTSRSLTFNAILEIFLRHLQEIPCSPPTSPDNGIPNFLENGIEEALPDLITPQDDSCQLHQLVSEGNVFVVRDLLTKIASRTGINSLYLLLKAQNANGQTTLHLACRRGSSDLVNAFLEYEEANVVALDKDGEPPLVYSLAVGFPECVHIP